MGTLLHISTLRGLTMSDAEGEVVVVQPEVAGPMDLQSALQEVLKTAVIYDGVARGLNEAVRALDKRQAHLCLLAKNCAQPEYVRLIEALCSEHNIALLKVDDNKKLGEMSGLCKIDQEGKPRKVVGCSCVVIRDYGKEGQAHDVLQEHLKKTRA